MHRTLRGSACNQAGAHLQRLIFLSLHALAALSMQQRCTTQATCSFEGPVTSDNQCSLHAHAATCTCQQGACSVQALIAALQDGQHPLPCLPAVHCPDLLQCSAACCVVICGLQDAAVIHHAGHCAHCVGSLIEPKQPHPAYAWALVLVHDEAAQQHRIRYGMQL